MILAELLADRERVARAVMFVLGAVWCLAVRRPALDAARAIRRRLDGPDPKENP